MRKVTFRLISLVLALALCLLPTAAGALYLKPTDQDVIVRPGETMELEFTVGEPAKKWIECVLEDGEEKTPSFDASDCYKSNESGLAVYRYFNGLICVEGTPKKACCYTGKIVIGVGNDTESVKKEFFIKFIINEKETPVPPPPTVPTVVDNVIYNAAPEHEQALIRGVREWCNVRAGAGTDSAVIGRANLGQQISLLRWNADESWCFVEFNGLQGWIAKQFILPIK